jgi:hypothetical protein
MFKESLASGEETALIESLKEKEEILLYKATISSSSLIVIIQQS